MPTPHPPPKRNSSTGQHNPLHERIAESYGVRRQSVAATALWLRSMTRAFRVKAPSPLPPYTHLFVEAGRSDANSSVSAPLVRAFRRAAGPQPNCLPGREEMYREWHTPPEVAQICNLLYRRIAFCRALTTPTGYGLSTLCRLQIGDTAD
jgi:hypothetical protein